ncbi:uncharacterized protein BJ171DRAFT_38648 [Polychytrium aggregatum]|uniref:uncharacterized protein n=1 Tax=Polychytrium aggregatum TaxID=110093 RepID=UPI0022FF3F1C|nr:uncharacterized protein BJ171DRAFT_38648 [Polychytrium aggregatum]KAI9190841.1 hypothetical protein BJ171DRAFT_38648 [Polychytrium aggregatum]
MLIGIPAMSALSAADLVAGVYVPSPNRWLSSLCCTASGSGGSHGRTADRLGCSSPSDPALLRRRRRRRRRPGPAALLLLSQNPLLRWVAACPGLPRSAVCAVLSLGQPPFCPPWPSSAASPTAGTA